MILNTSTPITAPALSTATLDINLRTVTFNFDQAIASASVASGDLEVTNLTLTQTFAATSVTRSADGRTLTFTLPPLTDGSYRFRIPAGAIAGENGVATTADAMLSGPTAFILAADANRDRTVDFADLVILAQNYNQTGKTFSQGNFDYSADGKVDFADLVILAPRYNVALPALAAILAPASGNTTVKGGRRPVADLLD